MHASTTSATINNLATVAAEISDMTGLLNRIAHHLAGQTITIRQRISSFADDIRSVQARAFA